MKFHAILTTLSPGVFYVVDYTERPRLKGVVPFSGCRYVERKGFQELKNTRLSFSYLKGPFKISRTDPPNRRFV